MSRCAARGVRFSRSRGFSTEASTAAEDTRRRLAEAADGDSRTLAYALGFCGLLPFAALTTEQGHVFLERNLQETGGQPLPYSAQQARQLQVMYGSSIVSFLGAPHWGLAMATQGAASIGVGQLVRYAWGVTPSLLAWPLPAMPVRDAQLGLLFSLGVCLVADAAFLRRGMLPSWYFWHLRVPLTVVATTCVGANALAAAKETVPMAPEPVPQPVPGNKTWWRPT